MAFIHDVSNLQVESELPLSRRVICYDLEAHNHLHPQDMFSANGQIHRQRFVEESLFPRASRSPTNPAPRPTSQASSSSLFLDSPHPQDSAISRRFSGLSLPVLRQALTDAQQRITQSSGSPDHADIVLQAYLEGFLTGYSSGLVFRLQLSRQLERQGLRSQIILPDTPPGTSAAPGRSKKHRHRSSREKESGRTHRKSDSLHATAAQEQTANQPAILPISQPNRLAHDKPLPPLPPPSSSAHSTLATPRSNYTQAGIVSIHGKDIQDMSSISFSNVVCSTPARPRSTSSAHDRITEVQHKKEEDVSSPVSFSNVVRSTPVGMARPKSSSSRHDTPSSGFSNSSILRTPQRRESPLYLIDFPASRVDRNDAEQGTTSRLPRTGSSSSNLYPLADSLAILSTDDANIFGINSNTSNVPAASSPLDPVQPGGESPSSLHEVRSSRHSSRNHRVEGRKYIIPLPGSESSSSSSLHPLTEPTAMLPIDDVNNLAISNTSGVLAALQRAIDAEPSFASSYTSDVLNGLWRRIMASTNSADTLIERLEEISGITQDPNDPVVRMAMHAVVALSATTFDRTNSSFMTADFDNVPPESANDPSTEEAVDDSAQLLSPLAGSDIPQGRLGEYSQTSADSQLSLLSINSWGRPDAENEEPRQTRSLFLIRQ
ncbi:hypothetical protein R3P38DRAFT_3263499 [Favolaschia claudopus]|uniref:Uncharacterized protein n=1 Tax=Favolaschia claudopus TaxID=2862362 RepID=A0AAW0CAN2_9AGAR